MNSNAQALAPARSAASDYLELTKPRITLTVTMTALVGFVMGTAGPLRAAALLPALLGTALVAAGASVLNMVLERRSDARMRRTEGRPLPAGRLRVPEAVAWGMVVTLLGLGVLALLSTPMSVLVALATWLSYVFLYTPLKAHTSLATIVGAVPGALPPVIGWAAATGRLDPGAFVLFAILFLWQIPHFLAIAWIYRDDYARAGLPMLPVLDPEGGLTGRQATANAMALLLVSLTPAAAGMVTWGYLPGAVLAGLVFVGAALRTAVVRSLPAARALFVVSILYLLALSALLLAFRA